MLDFIELFNAVAAVAKPTYANQPGAKAMSDKLAEIGIDSLDGMVVLMYLCELYGIDDATSRGWKPATVGEAHDLLTACRTQEPSSVASALAAIQ
jgi:acyl carrier protein